jgi:ribonuclease P protein component
MLPTKYRLKREQDFASLAKSRKTAYSKFVSIKVKENALPHSRFGIVVGLRISKKAVVRNLIRRRIREIIRPLLPELTPGYDVMVLASNSALKSDFKDLETSVHDVLKKIGLFKK